MTQWDTFVSFSLVAFVALTYIVNFSGVSFLPSNPHPRSQDRTSMRELHHETSVPPFHPSSLAEIDMPTNSQGESGDAMWEDAGGHREESKEHATMQPPREREKDAPVEQTQTGCPGGPQPSAPE